MNAAMVVATAGELVPKRVPSARTQTISKISPLAPDRTKRR